MKRNSITFLQILITLIGIGALALLLWMPHTEGVNAGATSLSQIYLDDPFLMLVYAGSIPFFIALYQAMKVLGHVKQNKVFSETAVKRLRTIKYCALAIIGFVVVEEIFIMLNHGEDDAAGAMMLGFIIAFGSVVVAVATSMLERVAQNGVDIKSENDLTI